MAKLSAGHSPLLVQPRARRVHVSRARPILSERLRASHGAFSGVALAACLLGVACTSAMLVPLSPTEDGIASVHQGQLELRAQVQPGSYNVPDTITPIQIWVHNSAQSGVYVALDDIQLLAAGKAAEPLEPGSLRPRPLGVGLDPASPFAASSQGAVGAAPVVPESGMGMSAPTFANAKDAAPLDPQRRQIVESAFPGGLIAPGATERGFVYFPTPTETAAPLTLRVRIRSVDGVPLQTLEIPYALES
jgi:hypothetical protein